LNRHDDDEPFLHEVQQQAKRIGNARGAGFWQGLAAVGAVGWMVVIPAVAGALAGHWLDQRWQTGVYWTLSLLVTGVMLGSVSAWRHVRKELEL
jgi:ATP synthase protein I